MGRHSKPGLTAALHPMGVAALFDVTTQRIRMRRKPKRVRGIRLHDVPVPVLRAPRWPQWTAVAAACAIAAVTMYGTHATIAPEPPVLASAQLPVRPADPPLVQCLPAPTPEPEQDDTPEDVPAVLHGSRVTPYQLPVTASQKPHKRAKGVSHGNP